MEEKNKTLSQEQIAALFCAANEKNITSKSVLEEIEPLLEYYFNCDYELHANRLTLTFLNGQTVSLTADVT